MKISRLLALPMALLMSVSAAAADIEYEGEVDIYDGSPAESTESYSHIKLPDGSEYDKQQQMFLYYTGESDQVLASSVADGMITTKSVTLKFQNSLEAKLYRDGEEDPETDIESISEPGSYTVIHTSTDVEQQLISFTILPEKTGAISSYKLPLGFDLKEVSVSGNEREITDVSLVDMKEDGNYVISYHCNLTNLDYGLAIEIDHTPPEITIENINELGKARGKVVIKGVEKTDKAVLKFDGEDKKFPSDGVVTMPGKYELTVTDDAGNSVTKKFTITFYLNYQGVLFGVILFGAIVGVIVYMVMARKKMRVR